MSQFHVPPVFLMTLFHVHFLASPLPRSRSTSDSLDFLIEADLIISQVGIGCGWGTTARGVAHVNQLCQQPLPVPMEGWMNPVTKEFLV